MASNPRYQIHKGRNDMFANYAYDLAGNCVWFFAFFGAAASLIQMFQIGNLRHRAASLEGKRPTEGRSGSPTNKVGSE